MQGVRLAWCTTIKVPYDYFSRAAGTIRLGFRWYPATGGPSSRTIVAVQGGPGYPTTDYAYAYRATLPLLAKRNLLLVDLRGTGTSSPFTCKALQDWTVAGQHRLVHGRYRSLRQAAQSHPQARGGHGYVQASDLYTTANAARDLALLLRKLRTGKVDFYGDSYGTFFGQVFTAHFHRMLRSVTLDRPTRSSRPIRSTR